MMKRTPSNSPQSLSGCPTQRLFSLVLNFLHKGWISSLKGESLHLSLLFSLKWAATAAEALVTYIWHSCQNIPSEHLTRTKHTYVFWCIRCLVTLQASAAHTMLRTWSEASLKDSHVTLFRGGAFDGGLGQEGAGVPDLYGGHDAPSQDLAMQGRQ